MSLVTKAKNSAGGLYGQARAKYGASPAAQKAGQQAGHTASQVAGKLRDASGKATAAVKDARSRRPGHR